MMCKIVRIWWYNLYYESNARCN